MFRKDCDKNNTSLKHSGGIPEFPATTELSGRFRLYTSLTSPSTRTVVPLITLSGCLFYSAIATCASAETVRVFHSAVVTGEAVRLGDVCEFIEFDEQRAHGLRHIEIEQAPVPGGSQFVDIGLIRKTLQESGVKQSTLMLKGAMQCAVSRPSITARDESEDTFIAEHSSPYRLAGDSTSDEPSLTNLSNYSHSVSNLTSNQQGNITASLSSSLPQSLRALRSSQTSHTFRSAIQNYFDEQLARYGGRARITFDRTSEQVLNLTGPPYEFSIRRRSGSLFGLVQIEVDVLVDHRKVQAVPLVVEVSMRRPTLVAKRAINQGAAITKADVELVEMSYQRTHGLGLVDPLRAIGQQAKRLIGVGTVIELSLIESIPLVHRGQIVSVVSTVGGIRVTSAGKAMHEGRWGEVIKIRSSERDTRDFDAVVTGPGTVEVSAGHTASTANVPPTTQDSASVPAAPAVRTSTGQRALTTAGGSAP